jgi:hypothetical protein
MSAAADDNQCLIKSRAKGNDLPTIVSKIVMMMA